MKIYRFLFAVVSLMFPVLLSANSFCVAPAPSSGHITEQGNDFASIDWDAVPGALSYEVTTTDTDNGQVVAQVIVTNNNHTQGSLIAGSHYEIEVRSSYCTAGPYGEPLSFNVHTDIVIVDIILQMQCVEEVNTSQTPVLAGDETILDIQENGCYRIQLETDVTGEPKTVEIGLKLASNGQLLAGNLEGNPSEFEMTGQGPVLGRFASGDENIQLFSLAMNQQGPQYRSINFEWLAEADININYCSNCQFVYDNDRDKLQMEEEQSQAVNIKMHPNPVNSLLQLQIPQEGQVQVYDLNGKQWFYADAFGENQTMALDVNSWPSGTYILRWHQADLPPLVQYFLKH